MTLRATGGYTPASVAITGGTIDGAVIGGVTPAAITGTTITATTNFALSGTGSAPTNGIYLSAGPALRILGNNGGATFIVGLSGNFNVSTVPLYANGTTLGLGSAGTMDVILDRDAANILALKNGNAAQRLNVYAGNGGNLGVVSVNESLTIAAAATTDSATTIPAGAIILSVAVRVTTVIPTAATFTMTAATGGTTFNTAAVSTAATSTDLGTAAGALYTSAGTKVRITPNLTPGAATGVVRLTIYYFLPTAATS